MYDKTQNQMNNGRWDITRAIVDQVDHSDLTPTCSVKVNLPDRVTLSVVGMITE
jgi:hypothetical protein